MRDAPLTPQSAADPAARVRGDEQLLRRFIAGEPAACRMVERWARDVVRFRPYGVPHDECDDIVQQTTVMIWRACSKEGFTLRIGLRAFVRKVTMARCIDALRKRRPSFEIDESIVDPSPQPHEVSADRDDWSRVRAALRRLGTGCQEIIRLHYLEELPYAEIAARLGRAEPTLRVRMFNCMKEIRRLLAHGGDPV